jgi:4-hydroxybenzoate polyprenyltransferase
MFGTPAFWLGLVYCTFPLGLLLYGWNDLADRVTDRLNPRKDSLIFGARGTDAQLARLPHLIAVVQAPFLLAFLLLLGWKTLVWFAAVLLVNWLYNRPKFPFKSHAPLDMLNQAGYLLVFPLSSWLNGVPQLPWATFLFSATFAMHSHLFGQIMDIVPDREAGRRTTAICLGIVPAKILLVVMLAGETALVTWAFKNPYFSGAMALGTLWILFDLTVLFRNRLYPNNALTLFALGLNVAMFSTMHWVWLTGVLLHMR